MVPDLHGKLPRLEECQMYISTEPCEMCEGAIYTMKVGKDLINEPQVVYGLDKESLSEIVRGDRKHERSVLLSGPNLLEEAKVPQAGFWR